MMLEDKLRASVRKARGQYPEDALGITAEDVAEFAG